MQKTYVWLKFFFLFLLFIIVCPMNGCVESEHFILVSHGQSSYKIILPIEASPSEKHAAKNCSILSS